MKTSKLLVAAVIRLSLLTGAAVASQGDANSPRLAMDAHLTIGQTAQPEPIVAIIAQLFAQ